MKVLSWNVRGLEDVRKRVTVKRGVLSQRPDVLFLHETKCQAPNKGYVRSVWGSGCMGWVGRLRKGLQGVCGLFGMPLN